MASAAAMGTDKADEIDVKFQMICLLLALGVPEESICKKAGVAPNYVDAVKRSQQGQENVIRMQNAMYPDIKVRIKKMTHLALDVQMKTLMGGSDVLKNKVAESILDRDIGKATQVVESRSVDIAAGDVKQLDKAIVSVEARLKKHEEMAALLKKSRATVTIPIESKAVTT